MTMQAITVSDEVRQAFDADYALLFAELTRLCRALGAGANAEDLAQEALVYGRDHLGQLRDAERVRPWLRRIAVRSVARARRRRDTALADDLVFVPVDRDLGLDAGAAIARLPERERLAVVLVY